MEEECKRKQGIRAMTQPPPPPPPCRPIKTNSRRNGKNERIEILLGNKAGRFIIVVEEGEDVLSALYNRRIINTRHRQVVLEYVATATDRSKCEEMAGKAGGQTKDTLPSFARMTDQRNFPSRTNDRQQVIVWLSMVASLSSCLVATPTTVPEVVHTSDRRMFSKIQCHLLYVKFELR